MTDANCKDILGGLGVCCANGVRDATGDDSPGDSDGTDSARQNHHG